MGDVPHDSLGPGLGWIDLAVILGVFALTTLVGALAGRQATIRGYFLGGRKLPWWAVSASIVATEISAVTLVSVPYVVFKPGGNFTYLQLTLIGSVLARFLVAWLLVPAYYEREIYSPYDFMGDRLGPRVKLVATGLFTLGGVLSQSARVYLTAIVLQVVLHGQLAAIEASTGIPSLRIAVGAIGAFAVLWTWAGGITTVVWTDVVLFLALVAAAVVALLTVVAHIDTGWERFWRVALGAHKLTFLDFDASPVKAYTFWAAAIASSWGGVGAYGIDQLMAQRIFCCRGAREARLAIVTSSIGVLVTVLVALVGVGLFAYYEPGPLTGEALALYQKNGDAILPIFVMQIVPAGLKGLIVAGILAAAISSLDGILAALSQTALSAVYLPWRARLGRRWSTRALAGGKDSTRPDAAGAADEEKRALFASRMLVLAFAAVLCALGVLMQPVSRHYGSVLDLALTMAAYTQGALIAGFALAFLRLDPGGSGFLWSAPLSVMAVFAAAWHGPRSNTICLVFAAIFLAAWLALRALPALRRQVLGARAIRQAVFIAIGLALLVWVNRFGLVPVETVRAGEARTDWMSLAFPWYVPIGSAVAFVFGCLLARPDATQVVLRPRSGPVPARPEAATAP